MRILHICSGSSGGAALSAKRLASAQSKFGDETLIVDINFMKLHGRGNSHALRRKALSAVQQLFTKKRFGVLTPYSYPYLNLKVIHEFKPDVVHIHNWYNIVNYRLIEEVSKTYPLVFTLHDERLLTGGCHNTLECNLHKFGCLKCPATRVLQKSVENDYIQKTRLFKFLPRYAIAAPSFWLSKKATESGLFGTADRIIQISNIIELDGFDSAATGQRLQPREEFRILFVAADIEVKLKGFQILATAFEELTKRNQNTNYVLSAVGASDDESTQITPNGRIHFQKPVNQAELRELMRKSSVLVVPSLSENSPNIIAEAQMAGVIVVASNVGGIPEMVENGVTGFLFQPNPDNLTKCLSEVQGTKIELLDRIRADALKRSKTNHDSYSIAQKYRDLYSSLQKHNK